MRTYFCTILSVTFMARGNSALSWGFGLGDERVSRKREMGKLSSFLGGCWRAGWLVLSIALLFAIDGALAAKAARLRDRSNDSSWGNASRDSTPSRDPSARSTPDGSRGNSDAGARPAGPTGANDKGNDKNGKNKDDDDDDDGRGNSQSSQPKDGGKPQNKGVGAGKANADDAEPPKTVVEMLQRMLVNSNAPGAGGDAKSSNRADPAKPADADKAPKADAGSKKDAAPSAGSVSQLT